MPRPGIRSRAGCFTCRRRKKKCNEEKPMCSGCRRNCLECSWPSEEDAARGNVKRAAKNRDATSAAVPRPPAAVSTDKRAADASSATDAAVVLAALRHPPSLSQDQSQSQNLSDSHTSSASIGAVAMSPLSPTMPFIQTPMLASPMHHPSPPQIPSVTSSSPSSSMDLAPRSSSSVDGRGWRPGESNFNTSNNLNVSRHDGGPRASTSSASPAVSDTSALLDGEIMHHTPVPDYNLLGDMNLDDGEDDMVADELVHGRGRGHGHGHFAPMQPAMDGPEAGDPSTACVALSVPAQVSLFPQHDADASSLLSYYLTRTANSMGNGSTELNPFICTFVPLAFSNQLVLQLILAQSAVHRQVGHAPLPTDQLAQRYYTDSLRLFRSAVGDYMSGKSTDKLVLTTGSLILSLTEVARGDIDGNIFDHLIAAKSLLVELFTDSRTRVPVDLMDFLVEYYTHMSALSMISVDAQHRTNPLLDVDIEKMARNLMAKKYVGQLCGCWLELLVTIPHVFDLGQRMRGPAPPSPDDITMFAFLQAQIMAFKPEDGVGHETRLAGLIFQQAVLLYLWSILGWFQEDTRDGLHAKLMETAVVDALSLLDQFPATCRINTSLCWPLTVIGCCTTDESLQDVLRTRLQTMFNCIGLGNMGETLVLLERVWSLPLAQRSPWALCKVMQEHQTWISFA